MVNSHGGRAPAPMDSENDRDSGSDVWWSNFLVTVVNLYGGLYRQAGGRVDLGGRAPLPMPSQRPCHALPLTQVSGAHIWC